MKTFLRTACILFLAAGAQAAVVRPAPNFALASTAKASTLKSFRGQPVVIVFARDARERRLLSQMSRLERIYGQLATERVVFIIVLQDGSQDVHTNIPYSVPADPAQVAADYGVSGKEFAIGVVGSDGNLDQIIDHRIPASGVTDAIYNNYDNQAAERAGN